MQDVSRSSIHLCPKITGFQAFHGSFFFLFQWLKQFSYFLCSKFTYQHVRRCLLDFSKKLKDLICWPFLLRPVFPAISEFHFREIQELSTSFVVFLAIAQQITASVRNRMNTHNGTLPVVPFLPVHYWFQLNSTSLARIDFPEISL